VAHLSQCILPKHWIPNGLDFGTIPATYDPVAFKRIAMKIEEIRSKNELKYKQITGITYDGIRYWIPIEPVFLDGPEKKIWAEPLLDAQRQCVVTFVIRSWCWSTRKWVETFKGLAQSAAQHDHEPLTVISLKSVPATTISVVDTTKINNQPKPSSPDMTIPSKTITGQEDYEESQNFLNANLSMSQPGASSYFTAATSPPISTS